MISVSGICGINEMNSASVINDVEFTEGGGASKCPDTAETLTGCFRNWCPDASEIGIRSCLINEQIASALRSQLSDMRIGLAKGGGADE